MNLRPIYSNIHFLLIASGLLVNTLVAVVYSFVNVGTPFIEWIDWAGFYGQGWPIMLQTFVILYFVYYSIRFFDKRFAHVPNGFTRFFYEILFVIPVGFGITQIFYWIFITYMVVPEDDMVFLERKLKMIQTIDATFIIVIYAFMKSFQVFRYLQQKELELVQWQKEHAQTQFETMKNQLNPHFLFNSLNALSSLVWVDADKAEEFIEKLSRSYRYLLEQKDRKLVPLANELQFINSFLFLVQERFGPKLQVNIQEIATEGYLLPPHTLMIVFDYLLANNSMSTAQPLRINIEQQGESLIIKYSQQLKEDSNPQAKEQFMRLQEQYVLLEKNLRHEAGYIELPLFEGI